ncbi:Latrophilin Cirl [Holothuria leucospilota]|uniref:Latrophilin Cirl n=1 Tax=Holothuria leucospilota TaxID=206669 RepID=A0A9Q1BUU2_HOLLE|nr:Latrophilin Cirl [Holothuria leucospilota]
MHTLINYSKMNRHRHHLVAILSVLVSYQCYCEDNYLLLCEGQRKNMTCSNDTIINVITATYGYNGTNEKAREECDDLGNINNPFRDHYSTNCHQPNSTRIVADKCDGLSECTVSASNKIFGDPCFGIRKYLELHYNCTQLYSVGRESYVTTGLPDEKSSREEDGVSDLSNGKENNKSGDGELKDNPSKEINNADDNVGLSPVSGVYVVAVSAGVLVAFIAAILSVGLINFLRNERCICTKTKKNKRETFITNNTRENRNTRSLDTEYEVVGNNRNTPVTDSANQFPQYERSIHVTSAYFECDYAVETIPDTLYKPQAIYLNIE